MPSRIPSLADLVVQRAPMGVVVLEGQALRFRYTNPAYCAMVQLDRDVVGECYDEVFPRERALVERLRAVIRTGRSDSLHEYESHAVTTPEGGPTYWNAECFPLDSRDTGRIDAVTIILQDVTGSVLTRRRLVESEARFRVAQELSPDGFVILRPLRDEAGRIMDFRWVYANPVAQRNNSMRPAPQEERTLSQTLPGVHGPSGLFQALVRVVETGEPADFEHPYRDERIDGWFRQLMVRVGDDVAVSHIDITDRKRAEQALFESEARFRGTFENSAVGIAHLGLDGRWLRVNEKLAETLGYTTEELLQRTFQDITHPDDLQADLDNLERLFRGEIASYQLEKRYRRKDGGIVWADLTVALQRDAAGRPQYAIGFLEDSSERKRAEMELRRTEGRLRLAVGAAPLTLLTRDRDLRLTWVYNPQAGEDLSHYLGTKPEDVLPPEDAEQATALYRSVLATGQPAQRLLCMRFALTNATWVYMSVQPLQDEQGNITGLAAAMYDVSEQRALMEGLEQSNQALERFARTVAHDLKAPLQTISSTTSLLARLAANKLEARESAFLERIHRSVAEMANLIDGVLEYAQAIRLRPQNDPVDLNRALDTALDRLAGLVEETGARIRRDPLPTVPGSEVLLTQVWQNLIGNALKFRAERTPQVDIGAERRGDEWVLSVRDNGIGLPEHDQERLFEAFIQADHDIDYAGTGLGLALVREAIQAHGGRVWVRSRPGEGAEFFFALPTEAETQRVDRPAL